MAFNVLIGGSAGQGMATLSGLLQKILKRQGYYIFSHKDYMSRVRGGHNFVQIRFGSEPISSHEPQLDVIIALDHETVQQHQSRLRPEGVILCDSRLEPKRKNVLPLPMKDIAKDIGNPRVFGTIAIGAFLKLFNLSTKEAHAIFNKTWENDIGSTNYQALVKGYALTEPHFKLKPASLARHILVNSNEAIALGALAAGMSFYAAYPMTPATSIMTYLSKKMVDAEIFVEQAEDEIAAVNMAIGASYAGIRAMTSTSGGGFSLMTEALGFAAISETPLVIVNVQRPGPATGLPTRTSQSDLSFILNASQDEFPIMVIAVKNPEDAFYQTIRAFDLADHYQMSIIILSDEYLADAKQTVPYFDYDCIESNRYLLDADALDSSSFYKRYKLTSDGISPRLIPSKTSNHVVLADSHEHDEFGHITEDKILRSLMMQKRMKKLDTLQKNLKEPVYYGVENPNTLLLGWGSTEGALIEVIHTLNQEGVSIGALIFGDLWPLPTEKLTYYGSNAQQRINVEHNYTGQLSKLIRQETGIICHDSILKYDGRQMSASDILSRLTGRL